MNFSRGELIRRFITEKVAENEELEPEHRMREGISGQLRLHQGILPEKNESDHTKKIPTTFTESPFLMIFLQSGRLAVQPSVNFAP